eukprot:scaffold39961_cov40-Cyclotella_meneghiniana.AAC.3
MLDLAEIGHVNAKVRALYLLASTKGECYLVEGTNAHKIAWPDPDPSIQRTQVGGAVCIKV